MAHRRRPLALALGLNTVVLIVEVVSGVQGATTVRSIASAHQELLWPPAVVCGHADDGKLTKPREVL